MRRYWQTSGGSYTALAIFIDVAKVLAVLLGIAAVVATIGVASDSELSSSERMLFGVITLFGGVLYALLLFGAGALVDLFLGMDEKLSQIAESDDEP